MTRKLGMIESFEGNGDPFSFAAILNGYDPQPLRAAGWTPLSGYGDLRDPADFGIGDVRVTQAWLPDPAEADALRQTADLPHAAKGAVDTRSDGGRLAPRGSQRSPSLSPVRCGTSSRTPAAPCPVGIDEVARPPVANA